MMGGVECGEVVVRLEVVGELCDHVGCVWAVAWSPSGQWLGSCGTDKVVRVWKEVVGVRDRWELVASCSGYFFPRTLRSLAFAPDGRYLAVGGFDGMTTILEMLPGRRGEDGVEPDRSGLVVDVSTTLEGHESEVKSVAFSSSGTLLATCSRDKSIWVWDGSADDRDFDCLDLLSGHSADVKRVVWAPRRDDLLVSCSYDNSIRIWQEDIDSDDFLCVNTLTGHGSTVWDAAFDSTGTYLASVSADRSVIVWKNLKSNSSYDYGKASRWASVVTLTNVHSRPILTVDWSHASADNLIATGGSDNAITLLRLDARMLIESTVNLGTADGTDHSRESEQPEISMKQCWRESQAHNGDVNCVAWHPKEANLLASCGDDGRIRLWRVRDCHGT